MSGGWRGWRMTGENEGKFIKHEKGLKKDGKENELIKSYFERMTNLCSSFFKKGQQIRSLMKFLCASI